MAQFYADIQGSRDEATRMGSKDSGISGHIRGWDIGCSVYCNEVDGEDHVSIRLTSGSNGNGSGKCLGTWRRKGKRFTKVQ